MRKTDISKWLEKKERAALTACAEQYDKALAVHSQKLYKNIGLYELADSFQQKFDSILPELKQWGEKNKGKVKMCGHPWHGLQEHVVWVAGSKNAVLKAMIKHEFVDETKERQNIDKKRHDTRDEIRKNYAAVRAHVRNLKTAKLGLEYLQELGFNTTDLIAGDQQEQEITALATTIDTRYLFLKGEGKARRANP